MKNKMYLYGYHLLAVSVAVAAASTLGGCGKNERMPTTTERLKSVEEKQQTTADYYVPRKTVDYMADLKTIREANSKSDGAAEKAPERAAEKAPPREPAKSARAAETPAQPAAAASAAPTATVPPPIATPSFAPPPAPAAQPVVNTPATPRPAPEPVPAPAATTPAPTQVASAAPTARPASPPPTQIASPIVNVVAREQPEFPREAVRQGVESGNVRARLTINAAGDVTNVAILQAKPQRVFDRSVTASLSRWKFNPGADGRSYDTEIAFQR
jgi:TonB family protein